MKKKVTRITKTQDSKTSNCCDNSFGISSVVLGIIGIVFSSIYGIVLGVVGFIFAIKQEQTEKNLWSQWGKILAIISVVLGIIFFYLGMTYVKDMIGQ